MKQWQVIFLYALINSVFTFGQVPAVGAGTIKRFENFSSKYVAHRNVDVWLPENYDAGKKYAVLYMHDGQMLFDSLITWNRQEWKVDETVNDLLVQGRIKDVIIVAISNGGSLRHSEYFPQEPLMQLPAGLRDTIIKNELMGQARADKYLLFLTKELKPFIDANFSTYTNKQHTFIAGSSMGGLISLYAVCEYPEVFGGAACLSTHWPGSLQQRNNLVPKAFVQYMEHRIPTPAGHRIYFDHGTKTLDSLYPFFQRNADAVMVKKGYNSSNWLTREFDGEDHSEAAWSRRLHIPLIFLLGTQSIKTRRP